MNDELDRMNNSAEEIPYVTGQCKNFGLVCQFMHPEFSWLNSFQKMSLGNEYCEACFVHIMDSHKERVVMFMKSQKKTEN